MSRVVIATLVLVAFCLGAALSYYNWGAVRFSYLLGEVELPLIALILAAFVLGALTLLVLNAMRVWGLRLENRRLQRRLRDAEAELRNLRNLPVADSASAKPAAATPPNA